MVSGTTEQIFTQFLPRECYASEVYAVVVCLSVCLSAITLRYCIKTAKCK